MQCWIYKSRRKAFTYLYLDREEDFTRVPDALLRLVGDLELVLSVNLAERERLAQADIEEVRQRLQADGFYLQMPPSAMGEPANQNPQPPC